MTLKQLYKQIEIIGIPYLTIRVGSRGEKTDADLLRDLEVLIQPQLAATQRCKTLKDLSESDKISRLEDVSTIYYEPEENLF